MSEFNRAYWEVMYQKPLEELPWEIQEAPDELVAYVQANPAPRGAVAIDAGCGTGNFSAFLAKNGYIVTGVDYSSEAIQIAAERYGKGELQVSFIRGDIVALNDIITLQSVDLILDYKVLHHLDDALAMRYIESAGKVLKLGGRILTVCYAETDPDAAGQLSAAGKFGNTMYYRSADAVRQLFKGFKERGFQDVKLGKRLNHSGYLFVFENV